jgi:hypothetical protein
LVSIGEAGPCAFQLIGVSLALHSSAIRSAPRLFAADDGGVVTGGGERGARGGRDEGRQREGGQESLGHGT